MSLIAFAIVIGHAAIYGVVYEANEGAAAHLCQLMMVGQLPIVTFFVIKWVQRLGLGRAALQVLGLQAAAAADAFGAVWWLT